MEITSIVTRRIRPNLIDDSPIEIHHTITGKEMSRYKMDNREFNENNSEQTITVKNRKAESKKLIDKFAVTDSSEEKNEQRKTTPRKITELIGSYAKKPRIVKMEVVKEKDEIPEKTDAAKKKRSTSESTEEDETKKKKELRRDESRQSPLEGVMKPEEKPTTASKPIRETLVENSSRRFRDV